MRRGKTRTLGARMNRKGFIAGLLFGALVLSVRAVVMPAQGRLEASIFLLFLGFVVVYGAKLFSEWYRPKYEQEFRQNPGERMGWDVLWMIVTRRAPVVYVFLSPLGWFFIGLGFVQFIDAILKT